MGARIYQEPKSSMSSGRARTTRWVLDFASAEAKTPDPLTGWAGGADTREQVRLVFPDVTAAQAFADRHGITARIIPPPERVLKLQAYADNFR